MDQSLRHLIDITNLPTAPFHEHEVIQYLLDHLTPLPHTNIQRDNAGNVIVHYQNGPEDPAPLILAAHTDHPGFHVLEGGDGEIRAEFLGGVRDEYFAGTVVRFYPSRLQGRVVEKIEDPENSHKVWRLQVEGLVETGEFGMWDLPDAHLEGDRVYLRVADDLAGAAAIVSALEKTASEGVQADFYALFTRAEEVGFAGALAFCDQTEITRNARFVAVETSKELPGAQIGSGAIIRTGDKISVFSSQLTRYLDLVAQELMKVPEDAAEDFTPLLYQRALMGGGTCESTVYQERGFQSGALCMALGNYHNMGGNGTIRSEEISLTDYQGLVHLFTTLIRGDHAPDSAQQKLQQRLDKLLSDYDFRLRSTR